jgi:hypothetical protein
MACLFVRLSQAEYPIGKNMKPKIIMRVGRDSRNPWMACFERMHISALALGWGSSFI